MNPSAIPWRPRKATARPALGLQNAFTGLRRSVKYHSMHLMDKLRPLHNSGPLSEPPAEEIQLPDTHAGLDIDGAPSKVLIHKATEPMDNDRDYIERCLSPEPVAETAERLPDEPKDNFRLVPRSELTGIGSHLVQGGPREAPSRSLPFPDSTLSIPCSVPPL
jgi:hypothetical protein